MPEHGGDFNGARNHVSEATLKRISTAIDALQYGTIQITVHNSKVVQIDKIERIRVLRNDIEENGSGI
jgi:hypothetical protein